MATCPPVTSRTRFTALLQLTSFVVAATSQTNFPGASLLLLVSSLAASSSFSSLASSQSVPGASFFDGNGAPGAGPYKLVDDYSPEIFFDKSNFFTGGDPTYGHVQYVSEEVAYNNGYASITDWGTVKISRSAFCAVISDNTYTHGLFLLDLVQMPFGCGTWPAYWTLGPDWPHYGEIDIIEGVNTIQDNAAVIHTGENCSITGSGQTGRLDSNNCDTVANGNIGCGTSFSSSATPNNYGAGMNSIGGGVYATEWTSEYVKHWWFPRSSIPESIRAGEPDVATFGIPAVNAQGPGCELDQHLSNHSIIINICFCGSYAGQVYGNYQDCPQSSAPQPLDRCVDFVGNNPEYFENAYWEINSLRVYQMPAGSVPKEPYSTSLSSMEPVTPSTNTFNQGMGNSLVSTLSSISYTGPLSSPTISAITAAPGATETPAICPGGNSSVYTDQNGNGYTIACGSDYQGGTLEFRYTQSFELCLQFCDERSPDCLALAFTGGNGAGNCYLKYNQGSFNYDGATNAALRVGLFPASPSAGPLPIIPTPADPSPQPTTPIPGSQDAFTCPSFDGNIITDASGTEYLLGCGLDTAGGGYSSTQAGNSFNDCFYNCSNNLGPAYNEPPCNGFTYVGATDGAGAGDCYYKNFRPQELEGESNIFRVGAVVLEGTGESSSARESGSGSSSIMMVSEVSSSVVTSSLAHTTTGLPTATSGLSAEIETSIAPELSSTLAASTNSSELATPALTSSEGAVSPASSSSSAVFSSSDANPFLYTSSASTTSPSSSIANPAPSTSSTPSSAPPVPSGLTSTARSPSASATPCPLSTTDLCSSTSQTCLSDNRNLYAYTCGNAWVGTVIPTDDIDTVKIDNPSDSSAPGPNKRSDMLTEQAVVRTFGECQGLCDRTVLCVAFNFFETQCDLFSTVAGQVREPGTIAARLILPGPPPLSFSVSGVPVTGGSVSSSVGDISTPPVVVTSVPTVVEVSSGETVTDAPPPTTASSLGSRATVTIETTITSIAPTGGLFTSLTSGSFYINTTTSGSAQLSGSGPAPSDLDPSTSACLCYTCALDPVLVSSCAPPTGSEQPGVDPTAVAGGEGDIDLPGQPGGGPTPTPRPNPTCPNIAPLPGTGTTAVYTTYTLTTCGFPLNCPALETSSSAAHRKAAAK